MPGYLYALIGIATVLWFMPFVITGLHHKGTNTIDRRARWGILLEAVAYSIVWQGKFWTRSSAGWEIAVSAVFLALANALSWGGARSLGKHMRLDAALKSEHQLVRSGPYALVRHPIYTSMLCLLIGTGMIVATPLLLVAAILVFFIGTEIRVRIEDGLLADRFGEAFHDYRAKTSRYIPLVW